MELSVSAPPDPAQTQVTPVDVAVIPNLDITGAEGLPVAVLTVDEGDGFHSIVDLVYVASAQPLDRSGATLHAGPCLPDQPNGARSDAGADPPGTGTAGTPGGGLQLGARHLPHAGRGDPSGESVACWTGLSHVARRTVSRMVRIGAIVLNVSDTGRARDFWSQPLGDGATRVAWDYPEDADFVVLADPDGNLLCVVNAGL